MLAAGNFAAFSQFLATYSTLDFTMSPLADKGTWHLLPTTSAMLPTAKKNILTGLLIYITIRLGFCFFFFSFQPMFWDSATNSMLGTHDIY